MKFNELCQTVIRNKSLKPVRDISLKYYIGHVYLTVHFEDNTAVSFKINNDLYTFMCIMKTVHFHKKEISRELCIESPVGYHSIFGIVSQDTVSFQEDDNEIFIYFL